LCCHHHIIIIAIVIIVIISQNQTVQLQNVTMDTQRPSLIGFTLDTASGVLSLWFNEAIDPGSVVPSYVSLS